MKMEAPFIPTDENNFDINYFNQENDNDNISQEKLDKIRTSNEYIKGFKNYAYFNYYDIKNIFKEFVNPHKIYEEQKKEENKEEIKEENNENKININMERYRKLKIPELSPECKEIIKHNLFGIKNCKIKLGAY